MPSDKLNLIMVEDTGWIFSLFDVTSALPWGACSDESGDNLMMQYAHVYNVIIVLKGKQTNLKFDFKR